MHASVSFSIHISNYAPVCIFLYAYLRISAYTVPESVFFVSISTPVCKRLYIYITAVKKSL